MTVSILPDARIRTFRLVPESDVQETVIDAQVRAYEGLTLCDRAERLIETGQLPAALEMVGNISRLFGDIRQDAWRLNGDLQGHPMICREHATLCAESAHAA